MMHEYYEKLRNKIATHTSQITPNHYIEVFEEYVKEGKEIVYLSLSSGLSNTYESALMAVKLLEEDYDEVLCYGIAFFKKRCMVKNNN